MTCQNSKINSAFIHCSLPQAKGDGVQRATWPKELPLSGLDVANFTKHLSTAKLNKQATEGDHARGMCSFFFDMLEVQHQSKWHLISDAEQSQDVKLVCSILASKIVQ